MSSSSDKFTQSRKTQKQMFLKVSGGQICAPQRDIIMASPYKALSIWVKRFSEYLAYELRHGESLPVDWGLVTEYCALIGYYLTARKVT